MPGAGQDLALATPEPFARCRGEGGASQAAKADRCELVRADVEHGHITAINVEDPYCMTRQLNDPPRAGRYFPSASHNVPPLKSCAATHALLPAKRPRGAATDTAHALFHASHRRAG